MSVTDRLFAPLLSAPAKPLVTHYDDAVGSRIELSRATVANWAAKTANWLRDELDVTVGSPVSVALPAHWQTAAARCLITPAQLTIYSGRMADSVALSAEKSVNSMS